MAKAKAETAERPKRVTVSMDAEDYPALVALAKTVKRSAGAVVARLVKHYGDDYAERQLAADVAASEAERQAMRGTEE